MDPKDGSKDYPHPDIGNPLGKIIPRTPLNMSTCQRCHPPPGKFDPQNTDIITSCKGQYRPSIFCQWKSHSSPAVCDANLLPSLDANFTLTSGFYGFAEQQLLKETDPGALFRLKPGKCSHGGPRDITAIGNEDTKQDLVTPHWQFHGRAADLSKQATREFLDTVKIKFAILRQVFHVHPFAYFTAWAHLSRSQSIPPEAWDRSSPASDLRPLPSSISDGVQKMNHRIISLHRSTTQASQNRSAPWMPTHLSPKSQVLEHGEVAIVLNLLSMD
jgi:hypothetical protein